MTDAHSSRAARVLAAAQAQGTLPPDASLPADEAGRPWPVVLLTALGAWLAAIPLIVVVGMLLGDFISQGPATYVVAVLLLAGAVTVLRSRGLPVFVEQLAVPALLTGAGTLGFALDRDLPPRGTAAVLVLVVLALAAGIPRGWLRALLGALAAALAVFMLLPADGAGLFEEPALTWGALHLPVLLGLAAWAAQDTWLAQGQRAHAAAALEPMATGWLALLLVGLAGWSGMTLLAGGVLGPEFGTGIAQQRPAQGVMVALVMPVASVLLALAAARLVARDWPTLWQPLAAIAMAILVGLSWFMPALGAVLLVLAAAATTHRWRLAGLAALAAAWIVGAFYYQLHWTLGAKALVLTLAGVALVGLAWLAHRRQGGTPVGQGVPLQRGPALWIAAAAIATLAVANHGIWQKERLIAEGEPLFVQLAPVDPRSLVQGDYMQLAFGLPPGADTLPPPWSAERLFVVARRDARGVAQLLRYARAGEPLAADELRVELTPREGRWTLVSNAWFFREGDARRWEAARFGEFRVDGDGRALLVGLADAQLRTIPIPP